MPQSVIEKKQRFARMFPSRIEKLVDQFRVIGNCSSKSNYEFNKETVAKVWVHVLDAMVGAADGYGLKLAFTINGKTLEDLRQEGSVKSLIEDDLDIDEPLF